MMNSDLLTPGLLNDPGHSLREIHGKDPCGHEQSDSRASFEMVSEIGEIVGYVKIWHHDDDYAGFVHFDANGDVVDWKAFTSLGRTGRT